MNVPSGIPDHLGGAFTVHDAREAGVAYARLRRVDLARPFFGTRMTRRAQVTDEPFRQQSAGRRARAESYAPRLRPGQFFSHETAAALWDAPLPYERVDGQLVDGLELPLHVSTLGDSALVRTDGVIAHRARPATTRLQVVEGLLTTSPASTWASLGGLPLFDLVALGDHFCRVWRAGPGRPHAGDPPLTTIPQLQAAIDSGRRVGIRRLRSAIELIREDSWSPRESALRCHIVFAGLPEPELNHDVFDENGRFLACVDLAYPRHRVAIEYQGMLHGTRYAQDVERIAALRAAGWTVIEVTAPLFADPERMIARIRHALRSSAPVARTTGFGA